jgi:phage baseplate assembly protein W
MNRHLGIDIKLSVKAMNVTPSGDIDWVGDVSNLKQAIVHRIRTEVGALRWHPTYGGNVVDSISRPNTEVLRGKIQDEIYRLLDSEPRVQPIQTLQVRSTGNNTIEVELVFIPISQTTEENILLEVSYP